MSTHPADSTVPHPEDAKLDPRLVGVDYSEDINVARIHESILREKVEPREGMEPVSLWMMTIIMLTVLGGGIYLGMYSGGFRGDVYDEKPGAFSNSEVGKGRGPGSNQAAVTAAADPAAELLKLGKRQYSNNCASCHQATGMGLPNQNPPLVKSEYVSGSDRRLIAILLHGMEGPVTVLGAGYNGAMPAWGKNMNDRQIAAVLTFVRQQWGNTSAAISTEEVQAVRKELESRGKCWTDAELKALPETPVQPATAASAAEKKS